MIKIDKLNPFGRMCISLGMLPSSYKESLTYEEQLIWFCRYLEETVIPAVNNNAEALEELQNLYVEIKTYIDNYFDNLDVQEEINNKLDEMAESGELTEIIAQYLELTGMLTYNTLDDLKSAENIVSGSIVKTLGYYSINDSGSATYLISSETPSTYYETLNNGLYAKIIDSDHNVKKYGAKGDGINDDTDVIQYCINNFSKVYIPNGTYNTSECLIIPEDTEVIGENRNLTIINKINNDNTNSYNVDCIILIEKSANFEFNYNSGQILKNLYLLGNSTDNSYGIYSEKACSHTVFNNINIENVERGIYLKNGGWLYEISKLNILPSINGIEILNTSTTLNLNQTYVNGGSGTAYYLSGVIYSNFSEICVDNFTGTCYDFRFCNAIINGIGSESDNATKLFNFSNSRMEINNGTVFINDSSSFKCIEGAGSYVYFKNINFKYNGSGSVEGKFIDGGSNLYLTLDYCLINEKFLTDNTISTYSVVKVKTSNGDYLFSGLGKLSGIGNTQNDGEQDTILSNGNFNDKMGGIFFNVYGEVSDGYNYSRRWSANRKLGDIFINQAPDYNGIVLYQQISDDVDHEFTSKIVDVTTSGSNTILTLNNFTLDSDATYKHISIKVGRKVSSSSGGVGTIDEYNTNNNTITLKSVSGTFAANDTLTYVKSSDFNNSQFVGVQGMLVGYSFERPSNCNRGTMFYDRTLGKPIWWAGNKWIDATGTQV